MLRERIGAAGPQIRGIVVSLEDSFDLDSSSVEAWQAFFEWIAAERKRVVFARLKQPVHDLLRQAAGALPAHPFLVGLSVDDAVTLAAQR
jgi:hypothetical protein